MNNNNRIERLNTMIAEGRILRGKWKDTSDSGKERACLLAALSPEAGNKGSASYCPSSVMPPWLAHLTPNMDDNGSLKEWPAFVKRYASIASRWYVLDASAWDRLEYSVRAIAVREAMKHTTDAKVLEICETVAALCEARATGVAVPQAEFETAEAAARTAAEAAAARTAAAAAAAAAAAWAAVVEAAWAARTAAAEAAWDRLNTVILDAIEAEILRASDSV